MTLDLLYKGAGSEFFDDQQIVAQDLNNIEYTKIKTIRDTIVACMQQPGVAIDSLTDTLLKVVYVDSTHFSVNPGTAIDKYGRIIYVPSNTAASGSVSTDPHYHPQWPNRVNIAHGKIPNAVTTYYVNIYYTIQQDIAESGSFGKVSYTREYDSYSIIVETLQPSAESGGLCLASFQIDSTGIIVNSTITDLRSLLLFGSQSGISYAREIFHQLGDYWHTYDATGNIYLRKAIFSYRCRGETSMNVYFDVPNTPVSNASGSLGVVIFPAGYEYEDCATPPIGYPCLSGSIAAGYQTFSSAPASYSFPIDISSLSQDALYVVAISLFVGAPGDVYVRNTVIDVT